VERVVLPYWLDRPAVEAREIALAADQLGYTELWVGELYHFDAFALAGHLAATTQIGLTVGPVASGTRDPVSIARAVASVSVLGGRPARLALGASNQVVVGGFHGRPFGDEPARMRRVVASIRRQLDTGRSDTGYRSALGPVDAHIAVAAFGRRMLAVAADVADRVVVNLVTPEQAGLLTAAAGGKPVVAWVVAALDPSGSTRAQVASQVAHYLAAPGYAEMFERAGFGDLVGRARDGMPLGGLAGLIGDELLSAVTLYGSAADIAAGCERYRRAGVDVAIVPTTADDPGARRTLRELRSL
jgi:probable F420-dependent oxidoreductase